MEVEIIKAKGAGEDTSTGRKIDRLRVAAYCRVSTDDEDQIKSYNSMVRYYTDLIKSNKQWVFAGVFADKAITGTKTDKREEFQLLIQECLSGNIDLVIAKSIPRFARNTLDTLKYVRMLRERNIAVYFEVEKINTLKDGEFLLTILSSVAQQEVENTSAYVKKGLKMKMKRGELVGFQGCLGYDYDVVTKSLSINEEGAETVRYIFDRYVAGAGSTMIARELNEQGISTIKGNLWTSSSVMGIINNEKYKGDILLGKTFTVDPISKRRLENLGEEDRFYIKNHHEPIISEEKFARAQEIRERRNGGRKKGVAPGKREKFSRQYAFSCMLECGFCGASLSRRRWHSSSKYKKTIWQCVKSTKHGKRFCPDSKGIPEQVIEDAFIESYRMLCTDHKDVLEEFIKRVEKTLSEDSIEDKIEKLNKNAYNIQYKRKKLLESYLEGVVAKDIYEETDMGYEKKLSEVNAQLGMLEQQYDNEGSLQRRLVDFRKALSKNQILEGFDRGIFESIIEKVIVGGYDENGEKDPYKIIFIYKTGFKNEIGNAKERFGKKSKAVEKAKEMCSHIADEVKDVCSYVSDNTYRKRLPADAGKLNPILFLFTEEGGFFIAFFALFFTSRLCETTEMVYRKRSNERGRKMERESFIFYRSFYDSIKGLGDAEFAECMRFLCEYGLNGAEQTGGTLAEVVLKMAKPQIDANNQRRANGAKGGRPKASPSEGEQAVSDRKTDGSETENHRLRDAKPNVNGNGNVNENGNGNVNENGNGNGNENEKGNGEGNENASQDGQPHPFHPPSVEEVRAYCESKGYRISPERFMDYYTANGWRLGKSEMKDWKAVVRNWERQEAKQTENVSGYCRQESGKGVKGYGRCEGADAGSEKYDGTVL